MTAVATRPGLASCFLAGRSPLPCPTFERLGLDVTEFEPGGGWRPPVAAFELGNAHAPGTVGYAFWKEPSVRRQLAALFCLRRRPFASDAESRKLQPCGSAGAFQ